MADPTARLGVLRDYYISAQKPFSSFNAQVKKYLNSIEYPILFFFVQLYYNMKIQVTVFVIFGASLDTCHIGNIEKYRKVKFRNTTIIEQIKKKRQQNERKRKTMTD
ncbi:hypothetical protein ACJX0J_012245 [Zea mays]